MKLKLKLYKTPIRTVVPYCLEKWTMSTTDENALCIFKQKVIQIICEPIR